MNVASGFIPFLCPWVRFRNRIRKPLRCNEELKECGRLAHVNQQRGRVALAPLHEECIGTSDFDVRIALSGGAIFV